VDTYRRNPSIEAAPLQDETILFDPAKNRFCVLNRTASMIWSELATPSTTDNLAKKLCGSFAGVGLEDAQRDTDRALQEMLSMDFVVGEQEK
jgi:hypothetical protein